MEIIGVDQEAKDFCNGREHDVVDLVHRHLGLASIADVSSQNDGTFKIETATGSIIATPDLSRVIRKD